MKTTKATSAKATKTASKKTSVKNNPVAGAKEKTKVAGMSSTGGEAANQGQGVKKVPVPPRPKRPADLVNPALNVNISKKAVR